tara:strand:+ start:615 stop:1823 length:1209 start_codon:yes stop_codon:yes gene_type:complete
MDDRLETYYGLPEEIVFCKRCVLPNTRPLSYPEHLHTKDRKVPTLHIDDDGVCDPCRYLEIKEEINWAERELQLIELLDRYRRDDGHYDCIVPGSGGKDSGYAAHLLKYKYGMHPLTVTWPPILYTDYGYTNFRNWVELGGFDNVTFKPNGKVMRLLTKLSIENLLHPFQTFILGQKILAPKMAARFGVPLVFYGEGNFEYGEPVEDSKSAKTDGRMYGMNDLSGTYLGGVSVPELIEKYDLNRCDLEPFLPEDSEVLRKAKIDVRYLGYYIKWTPQESYYYAVENTGFQARPVRSEGTYSKYASIDDKIDDLHYYTTWIKFGFGRATSDAAQEIRNKHITREEGVALVRQFDGEFPELYFNDVMNYIGMDREHFIELVDKARSPHMWKFENGEWKLRHPIS